MLLFFNMKIHIFILILLSAIIYILTSTPIDRETFKEKMYLLGQFDPSVREDFVLVSPLYSLITKKTYLRKETYEAFKKMSDTAKKDNVNLKIVSATRNFEHQKDTWEKKWGALTFISGRNSAEISLINSEKFRKILNYTAAPGTSRHHWGTDIDINSVNKTYFDLGKGKREYLWLVKNAPSFGFCQTYNSVSKDLITTGHSEEKWHWSYLPLAKTFLEEYKNLIKLEDIHNFSGDENVKNFNLINDYVLNINKDCL